MRLEQAIKQLLNEAANKKLPESQRQTLIQVVEWLEELKECRGVVKELRNTIRQNEILMEPIWDTLAKMGVLT